MNASTMQAAVIEQYGQPFRLTEIARPVAGPGQVLVRIAASAVNPLDFKIRAGKAEHARHPLPAILGIDMAGVVESVGPGVAGFRAGDEVYGMTGGVGGIQGSLAQYAAVDADLLAIKPANLSMREAAALPLAFITSYSGIVDRAHGHRASGRYRHLLGHVPDRGTVRVARCGRDALPVHTEPVRVDPDLHHVGVNLVCRHVVSSSCCRVKTGHWTGSIWVTRHGCEALLRVMCTICKVRTGVPSIRQ